MQAMRAAGSSRSSPCSRAISAMERMIRVVVVGNSTLSPARPKKPPTAPVAATAALWARLRAAMGWPLRGTEDTAMAIADVRARWVAAAMIREIQRGERLNSSDSIGAPTTSAMRAATPGFSSSCRAWASSAMCAAEILRRPAGLFTGRLFIAGACSQDSSRHYPPISVGGVWTASRSRTSRQRAAPEPLHGASRLFG